MNAVTNYDFLPRGKNNAISPQELMWKLGFKDARALRADISRARADGQMILSSQGGRGGYYLPASDEEVGEYIKVMTTRAKSSFIAVRAARTYLKAHENNAQMSLDDFSTGKQK